MNDPNAAISRELAQSSDSEAPSPMSSDSVAARSPLSPTLESLPIDRHPKRPTVCMRCPIAIWFAMPSRVECHCPPLFRTVWSQSDPLEIQSCDAMIRAVLALEAEAAAQE